MYAAQSGPMKRSKVFRPLEADKLLAENPFPTRSKSLKTIDQSTDGGFIGRYRRSQFVSVLDDDNEVRKRKLHCWLFADDQQAGALAIIEYKVEPFLGNFAFFEAMDSDSQHAMEIADAICSGWADAADVTDYGPIVEIDRLWISPRYAKRGEWAGIVQELLRTVYRRRSLLVMKAFPLEYEHLQSPEIEVALNRRMRAMARHYHRLFGVMPFPGERGDKGWLYAIPDRVADGIEPPGDHEPNFD